MGIEVGRRRGGMTSFRWGNCGQSGSVTRGNFDHSSFLICYPTWQICTAGPPRPALTYIDSYLKFTRFSLRPPSGHVLSSYSRCTFRRAGPMERTHGTPA